jgi:hypothetical protein
MERSTRVPIQWLLSAALVLLATALVSSRYFYQVSLGSEFLWLCLASTAIIHLSVRPKWAEVGLLLLVTGAFSLIEFGLLGWRANTMSALALLGLSSVTLMGLRAIWTSGEESNLWLWAFVPAVLFVGFGWLTPPLLEYGQRAYPKVYDLYLYSFDASLGVQPSFLLGEAFLKWPLLKIVSYFAYLGLAIPIASTYAGQLLRNRKAALPVMLALLYCGPIGGIFYSLFPALGPAHLFQANFPLHPLSMVQARHLFLEPVALAGFRNAIPSLHMAWVVLAWWYCRGLNWWAKGVALGFFGLTVLATLGSGEHYLIDLVVAYPFSVMIYGLFALSLKWNDRLRVAAVLGGLSVVLGWLGALRVATPLFWASPVIPWALCVATVALSVWVQRRVARAVELEELGQRGFGLKPASAAPEALPAPEETPVMAQHI